MREVIAPAISVTELVARGHLRVVYQPIVELRTGRVVGHEALARGPVGTGLASPGALFEAAEREGKPAQRGSWSPRRRGACSRGSSRRGRDAARIRALSLRRCHAPAAGRPPAPCEDKRRRDR